MAKEKTLSDKRKQRQPHKYWYYEEDTKNHIKLAQQDVRGIIKTWHLPNSTFPLLIREMDRVFLKHFGAKLLSTDKEEKLNNE